MWHEARRSERKVHDMMDAARKRAQRRAVYLAKRRGDPQQSIQVSGSRCRVYRDDGLYQATEDQQGLIPWNGKQDIMIDRFDGRALLDFIRDPDSRRFRVIEKTEEEEELEEFVSFERFRDLIKHRLSDEEGLHHVNQEMEAKTAALFGFDRSQTTQAPANRGSYSQVGFSYDGDVKEENQDSDDDDDEEEDDEDEEDFNSDDSNDEGMDIIAKEFGVKRYGWLVYMDKKAKEEERRQKEVVKGDPAIRKLSRKERRKASQIERERERESARVSGSRVLHHDPYRSRSRSYSPSQSRRHGRGHSDDTQRSNPRAPKIEYITEFGGSTDVGGPKLAGYTPPSSPPSQVGALNRSEHCSNYSIDRFTSLCCCLASLLPSSGQILEALHIDPASGVSLDSERNAKSSKPSAGSSSGLAKLSKPSGSGSLAKQQGEKKETPQERLKRIMSKQLNKQIKKDTAAEMAKKREQERQRLEKLAETNRLSRYRHRSRSRSFSRSPPRSYLTFYKAVHHAFMISNVIAGTVEVQVGAEALEDTIPGLDPVHARVLYPQCGHTLVQYLTLARQGKTHGEKPVQVLIIAKLQQQEL
ncbi:hypothetical protein OSB04_027314 [Centaurea solstitialis]|uniref:Suppressor of white apricot N-terminal domain-containing protein n=1 Tax=Centaurea solstitialis TaxID=347529 RepID=A0AA38SEE1_9ASTR|nr:hypothetical protein OSB04_027314 [Centaurea solstitialis]